MENMPFLDAKKQHWGWLHSPILRAALVIYALGITVVLIFPAPLGLLLDGFRTNEGSKKVSSHLTEFHETLRYQSFELAADELWHSIIPDNGGFLVEYEDEEYKIYGLSMFHQLHCLQMFRRDFQELYARLETQNTDKVMYDVDKVHTLHCFDYLRQVFLCYADGTLEPAKPHPTRGILGVNGMIPHTCANPQAHYDRVALTLPLPNNHEQHSHSHA